MTEPQTEYLQNTVIGVRLGRRCRRVFSVIERCQRNPSVIALLGHALHPEVIVAGLPRHAVHSCPSHLALIGGSGAKSSRPEQARFRVVFLSTEHLDHS